jgi:hypothetical protein
VIHTKVARCAQLSFVEALCTSGDDQRPDKWLTEAIRGHQRPSEAIRGVVEGHQRGCRGGAPPNVPPRVALARPRRRERSSRPA